MEILQISENSFVRAGSINVALDCEWGENINIDIKGEFRVGKRCKFGDDIHIRGNNVSFGDDLFCSGGLRIGGGGRQHPNANFSIGDRCTIHNNFINVCEPVIIGNDVGLSPDVSILTHGYWQSVLNGYPAVFAGVEIGHGAIIGYRSIVLMGVHIGNGSVIGAGSVVTKSVPAREIWAGNPAKFIRRVERPGKALQKEYLTHILDEYAKIAEYHGIRPKITERFPIVTVDGCEFNVITQEFTGTETEVTDDFRDYVRKWGIRFYSARPFRSVF